VDKGVVGQWEEVREEEDDYYAKNALSKVDDEKRKELEKKGLESRAKTLEEIF
jgi:hypothetical protein